MPCARSTHSFGSWQCMVRVWHTAMSDRCGPPSVANWESVRFSLSFGWGVSVNEYLSRVSVCMYRTTEKNEQVQSLLLRRVHTCCQVDRGELAAPSAFLLISHILSPNLRGAWAELICSSCRLANRFWHRRECQLSTVLRITNCGIFTRLFSIFGKRSTFIRKKRLKKISHPKYL